MTRAEYWEAVWHVPDDYHAELLARWPELAALDEGGE